jgi:ABC-type transporter Mla subunit MlaD
MAELNELLDQAATEAGNLSAEIDEASDAVDTLVAKANALKDQVTAKGEEARRMLDSLKDALHQAEETLTSARGRADTSLAELGSRAVEVRGGVTRFLEKVKHSLDELETQKTRLVQDADTHAQSVEGALGELSGHMDGVAQAVDQQLTASFASVHSYRGSVETLRQQLVERKMRWDQRADELEAHATEQALVCVDGVNHVLADQSTAMVEMTNHIVEVHNTAMEDLKEKFATEARQAVATSLQALADELANLAQNAGEEKTNLTSKSDEVLGRVRAAVPILENLATTLDGAAAKLT